MGILSGIKDTYKKSEAAVIVQNLLEMQYKAGLLDHEPAKLANQLVGEVWDAKPDVFTGKFGQRPHKLAVAAVALANGVKQLRSGEAPLGALLVSLGNALAEVERNGRLYPFNSLDWELLRLAGATFEEAARPMMDAFENTDSWEELTGLTPDGTS